MSPRLWRAADAAMVTRYSLGMSSIFLNATVCMPFLSCVAINGNLWNCDPLHVSSAIFELGQLRAMVLPIVRRVERCLTSANAAHDDQLLHFGISLG